jgi:hypothetical protein
MMLSELIGGSTPTASRAICLRRSACSCSTTSSPAHRTWRQLELNTRRHTDARQWHAARLESCPSRRVGTG